MRACKLQDCLLDLFIIIDEKQNKKPHKHWMIYLIETISFSISESLISRFSIQGELGVSANWTQYQSGRSSAKEIEFEYRVTCAANYYGVGCGTLCRERDDNFGHIACSASGQKICLSGWQGEYCTERKCFSALSQFNHQQLCSLTSFRVYYSQISLDLFS